MASPEEKTVFNPKRSWKQLWAAYAEAVVVKTLKIEPDSRMYVLIKQTFLEGVYVGLYRTAVPFTASDVTSQEDFHEIIHPAFLALKTELEAEIQDTNNQITMMNAE